MKTYLADTVLLPVCTVMKKWRGLVKLNLAHEFSNAWMCCDGKMTWAGKLNLAHTMLLPGGGLKLKRNPATCDQNKAWTQE